MSHELVEKLLIVFGSVTLAMVIVFWTSALSSCLERECNIFAYIVVIGVPIAWLLVGVMLVLLT